MDEETFVKKVIESVGCDFLRLEDEGVNNSYYSHPTFLVNSLSEYISLITIISSVNGDDPYREDVIFRGMANDKYDLRPGLSRFENEYDDLERHLINKFISRRPDAFVGLSDFDILAKMQHYGLPTRLLDFSLNPLVALYFACESEETIDGRVLCHSTYLQNDDALFANTICSVAVRKEFDCNYTVDEYFCNEKLKLKKYLLEAYIYDQTTVIIPKYWNQRIANQAGVFMLFPNKLYDRYRNALVKTHELGADKAIKDYVFGKVEKNVVEEIVQIEPIDMYKKYSDSFLTREYFRILYDSHKNAYNDFWDEKNKYFENRFIVSAELNLLDQEIVENNFCSIIIKAESKKKILRELSYIGFGMDYIYPELEYTAKEIKRIIGL